MTGYGETNNVDEFLLEHGEDSIDDVVEHHGIKGMRWGVRRTREELDALAGRVRTKRRRKASKEEAEKRKQKENEKKKRESGYREPTREEKSNPESLRKINDYNQEVLRALRLDKEFKKLTTVEKKSALDQVNAFLSTPVGKQSLVAAKKGTPALFNLGKQAYEKADKKYQKK